MEQKLPYDNDTEDSVLGGIIHYPEEIDEITPYIVSDDVFGRQKSQRLWNIIKSMKKKSKPIDLKSVCVILNKDDINCGVTKYYVTGCTGNACLKGTTSFYASGLYEKYILRRVIIKTYSLIYGFEPRDLSKKMRLILLRGPASRIAPETL